MKYPGFISGLSLSPARQNDFGVLLNLFLERDQSPTARSEFIFRMAPGTVQYLNLGDGPVRGMFSIGGYIYAVAGGNVWQVDPSNIVTLLGTVANDFLPVYMCNDALQTLLVSDGVAYQFTNIAVTPVPGPPWTRAIDCCFMDSTFFVLDDPGTPTGGIIFFSAVNDALSFDPLDFFTAPASANKLVRIFVDHGLLWAFGYLTAQGFVTTPDLFNPFAPDKSQIIQTGIGAINSLQRQDDPINGGTFLIWQATNESGFGTIVKKVGADTVKISPPAIDALIQTLSAGQATSLTFQLDGHVWYQITFPVDNVTLRYDSSLPPEMAWSQVGWLNMDTGLQESHRGNCHARVGPYALVGDRETGILWLINTVIYIDNALGTEEHPIEWVRRGPIWGSTTKLSYVNNFVVSIEAGVGTAESGGDGGYDPIFSHRYSWDGGKSWSNNIEQRMGKFGETSVRAWWLQQGSGYLRQDEISGSAPVKTCIIEVLFNEDF